MHSDAATDNSDCKAASKSPGFSTNMAKLLRVRDLQISAHKTSGTFSAAKTVPSPSEWFGHCGRHGYMQHDLLKGNFLGGQGDLVSG